MNESIMRLQVLAQVKFPSPCGEKIVMNPPTHTVARVSGHSVSVPLRGKDSHEPRSRTR